MCGERRDARWVDAHYCCSACRTRDRVRGVLLEMARPVALMLCAVALFAVFYTAFLRPASDIEDTTWKTLTLLSLAAGICVSSGMLFREGAETLLRTLPVQMFLWAVGAMAVMFVAAWYLETHMVLYRDVRWF